MGLHEEENNIVNEELCLNHFRRQERLRGLVFCFHCCRGHIESICKGYRKMKSNIINAFYAFILSD